ncbi:MAG: hypothetical protein ACFFES_17870 [Candidatus Thorarchaeota archaeon]
MRRILSFLIGTGLAAAMIFVGIGCSSNPMSSEDSIPVVQEPNQDVVGDHVGPHDPGGYPMTPNTDIDKYDSDDATAQKTTTP